MTTIKTETLAFDIADYLVDRQSIASYLKACLEDGGIELFQKAIGDVARARGMSEVADASGVTRASLYKSLSESGSPSLSTIDRVISSLGLRLSVEPIEKTSEIKPASRTENVVKGSRKQLVTGSNRAQSGKVQMASNTGRRVVMAGDQSRGQSHDARNAKTGQFQESQAIASEKQRSVSQKPTKK